MSKNVEDENNSSILLLECGSRETNMDKMDSGTNLEMHRVVQFGIPRNNNDDSKGHNHPRSRKGTNPFSADLKYRRMIASRIPKEISDIFGIITTDDVEQLKGIFSKSK